MVYEGLQTYGPYTRRDGRMHVILVRHNSAGSIESRRTVSYPKYLVEKYLDTYIDERYTIDHIDGDFTNNELDNLRIVLRDRHSSSHALMRETLTKQCVVCGGSFNTTHANRATCSKHCAGVLSRTGRASAETKNTLVTRRWIVDDIPSVATILTQKLP